MSAGREEVRVFLDAWWRAHPRATAEDAAVALRYFLAEAGEAQSFEGPPRSPRERTNSQIRAYRDTLKAMNRAGRRGEPGVWIERRIRELLRSIEEPSSRLPSGRPLKQ